MVSLKQESHCALQNLDYSSRQEERYSDAERGASSLATGERKLAIIELQKPLACGMRMPHPDFKLPGQLTPPREPQRGKARAIHLAIPASTNFFIAITTNFIIRPVRAAPGSILRTSRRKT